MTSDERAGRLLAELSVVDSLDEDIEDQGSRVRLMSWGWLAATGLFVASAGSLGLTHLVLKVIGFAVFAGALTLPARRRLRALKQEKERQLLRGTDGGV